LVVANPLQHLDRNGICDLILVTKRNANLLHPDVAFFFEAIRVSLHIPRMQMRLTPSSRTTINLTMPNNNNNLVIPNNN
jgi:hypothetical protein